MTCKPKLAFLASHNGSAARGITTACLKYDLDYEPKLIVSNNESCSAFSWAQSYNLKKYCVNNRLTDNPDARIAEICADQKIDLIICSGYMRLVGPETIGAVQGRILNIHPALLPKYGGQGMYGRYVHQVVKAAGDSTTGATVHWVDAVYDRGEIVSQKTIPVSADMSVEMIEEAVKNIEAELYIETLKKIHKDICKAL